MKPKYIKAWFCQSGSAAAGAVFFAGLLCFSTMVGTLAVTNDRAAPTTTSQPAAVTTNGPSGSATLPPATTIPSPTPSASASPTPATLPEPVASSGVSAASASNYDISLNQFLHGVFNALPVGWYSVKDFGAKGDGVTDDSLTVQATINAAQAAGGGTVYFPGGTYLLNTPSAVVGSVRWVINVTGDNITLKGDGENTILKTTKNTRILQVGGFGKPEGMLNWSTYRLQRNATLPMSTAHKGDTYVALSQADAATFVPGDYIFIRTGQMIPNTRIFEPDSETNKVTTVDLQTGHVSLEKPLAKDYQQEYYPDDVTNITTTTPTAYPAPFGVAKVTNQMIRNFTLRDLKFRTEVDNAAALMNQIDGFTVANVTGDLAGPGLLMCDYRNALIENNRLNVRTEGDWTYAITTATGVTDALIQNNVLSGSRRNFLHMHEGSARVRAFNNQIIGTVSPADTGDENQISIRARAYDLDIENNYIYDTGPYASIYVDAVSTGGGIIRNNTIVRTQSHPNPIWIRAAGWTVDGNTVTYQ